MLKAQVYLRRVAANDYNELSERFAASGKHLRGWASSRFDKRIFEQMVAGASLETKESFLACCRADDAIVGEITLSQIFRRGFQNAYLGYYLFAPYTGRGYMTEAVGLMLRFAFNELRLHRIEANVQPENTPSIKVLKRCGFTKEGYSPRYLKIGGRWRDHERWAILREDFR